MKRVFRPDIHILVLLAVLLFSGCNEKDDPYKVLNVRIFSVSGTVTGLVDGGESVPLEGIEVNLAAYSLEDTEKTIPVFTDQYLTRENGTYQLYKISEEDCSNLFFEFTLVDKSASRATRYQTTSRNLYLNVLSPFYYPDIKAYEVKGNDFELYPATE